MADHSLDVRSGHHIMKITKLIAELKRWKQSHGDLEVEVIHNGFYGYHDLIDVTMPDNRRVLVLVTVPAEWQLEEIKEIYKKGTE